LVTSAAVAANVTGTVIFRIVTPFKSDRAGV
jgi:hypothetical protein